METPLRCKDSTSFECLRGPGYDHPGAYEPGAMIYAYVKAPDAAAALRFAIAKGVADGCVVQAARVKVGELYMVHIVGHMNVVVGWFCEPGEAPYPMGSCLLYRCD